MTENLIVGSKRSWSSGGKKQFDDRIAKKSLMFNQIC